MKLFGKNISLGLFLFMLYVCPLCNFLQEAFFATTNVFSAFYIILTAFLLFKGGKINSLYGGGILYLFLLVIICLMGFSGEWLAVMQSVFLLIYLRSKSMAKVFDVAHLSIIFVIIGVLCAVSCILELINFPLYASLVFPFYKSEVRDTIQTLYSGADMCGIMAQTSHAAGVILNGFYVLMVLKNGSIAKKWRTLFSVLFIIGLFLTGKRAHLFFGLVIWLSSYIITSSNKKRIKNFIVVAISVIITIPILVSIAPKLGQDNVLSKIIFSFQNVSKDKEDVLHGRDYLYEMAWQKVEEAPFTGHGWGSFKKTVDYRGGATDVHNVYLQLWAENGIFVLLLFIVMLLSLITKTIKLARFYGQFGNKYKDIADMLRFSFCIQGFFILYCLTGNCLYNIDFFSMYILAVSIMLAIKNKKSLIEIKS